MRVRDRSRRRSAAGGRSPELGSRRVGDAPARLRPRRRAVRARLAATSSRHTQQRQNSFECDSPLRALAGAPGTPASPLTVSYPAGWASAGGGAVGGGGGVTPARLTQRGASASGVPALPDTPQLAATPASDERTRAAVRGVGDTAEEAHDDTSSRRHGVGRKRPRRRDSASRTADRESTRSLFEGGVCAAVSQLLAAPTVPTRNGRGAAPRTPRQSGALRPRSATVRQHRARARRAAGRSERPSSQRRAAANAYAPRAARGARAGSAGNDAALFPDLATVFAQRVVPARKSAVRAAAALNTSSTAAAPPEPLLRRACRSCEARSLGASSRAPARAARPRAEPARARGTPGLAGTTAATASAPPGARASVVAALSAHRATAAAARPAARGARRRGECCRACGQLGGGCARGDRHAHDRSRHAR